MGDTTASDNQVTQQDSATGNGAGRVVLDGEPFFAAQADGLGRGEQGVIKPASAYGRLGQTFT